VRPNPQPGSQPVRFAGASRIGRLLIALLLEDWDLLSQPLLDLSLFFKRNLDEYYDRLSRVRTDGDWEGWTGFFLRGVRLVAEEAIRSAKDLSERAKESVPGNGARRNKVNKVAAANQLGCAHAKLTAFVQTRRFNTRRNFVNFVSPGTVSVSGAKTAKPERRGQVWSGLKWCT